jgi:hypothetical protein
LPICWAKRRLAASPDKPGPPSKMALQRPFVLSHTGAEKLDHPKPIPETTMPSVWTNTPRPVASDDPDLKEYSRVTLTVPVKREGVALTAGAEGIIVHNHADGSYSVEFELPTFEVVTIYATELKALT